MILRRRKAEVAGELEAFRCDVCKRTFDPSGKNVEDGIPDHIEVQEAFIIQQSVGYGSVFGDGNVVEIDVCQGCFKERLGAYVRVHRFGFGSE